MLLPEVLGYLYQNFLKYLIYQGVMGIIISQCMRLLPARLFAETALPPLLAPDNFRLALLTDKPKF
ncbi:hypothetical protein BC349_03180 [Flavihumibacter stibioxidans]|uniref:Uncharacterized protein n=1 Tax=Flavihumibacter stibioxidans TaxID=1834163 RepID=A0ABR7M4X5_9BACT|nr:hypothetical protein [Flavihumibacter stibioxidans]